MEAPRPFGKTLGMLSVKPPPVMSYALYTTLANQVKHLFEKEGFFSKKNLVKSTVLIAIM
jgi:hypothetical protein